MLSSTVEESTQTAILMLKNEEWKNSKQVGMLRIGIFVHIIFSDF